MTDRDLADLADIYREAVGRRDASLLPLAKSVQYSENGHHLRLDEGIWATASAAPEPYLTVADAIEDQVVLIGVIPEGAHDFVYGTRIRSLAGAVKEIETVIVNKRSPLNLLGAANLVASSPVASTPVPTGRRSSRAALAEVANGYFDGLQSDDGVEIPVVPECVRRVNGYQLAPPDERVRDVVAEEWGIPEPALLGVADQISSGTFRYIDAVEYRRIIATDDDRQIVVAAVVHQNQGAVRAIPELGLDTLPAAIRAPVSMLAFEALTVADGQIVAIESVAAHCPLGTTHGWNSEADPVAATGGRLT